MARKGQRQLVGLECTVCKSRNYVSQRNLNNTKDKLNVKKFCNKCHKTTDHKEIKV